MQPGILAAIVILSAELVIVVVVIVYLFCFKNRKQQNTPIPDKSTYKEKPDEVQAVSVEIVKEDAPILNKAPPDDTVSMGSGKSKSYSVTEPKQIDIGITEKSYTVRKDDDVIKPVEVKEEDVIAVEESPVEEINVQTEENNNKPDDKEDDKDPKGNEDDKKDASSSSSSSSNEGEHDHECLPHPPEEILKHEIQEDKIEIELSDHDSGHNTLPESSDTGSLVQERTAPSNVGNGITLSLIINHDDSSSSEYESSSSEEEDQSIETGITVTRWIEEAPQYQRLQPTVSQQRRQEQEIKESVPGKDELVVAGIINVTSGEKLTICQAVRKGLIPVNTAKMLLEAQAATGGIIVPRTGAKLSVSEAVSRGIVEAKYQATLTASEGAYYGYLDSEKGQNVSLCEAMQRGIFQKSKGLRLLAAQLATGGIIDPWTTRRYALRDALEKRLIDNRSAKLLRNPENISEFYDPQTGQELNYFLLQKNCIRDLDTGYKFLYVEEKSNDPNFHYQAELMIFQSTLRKKVSAKQLIDQGLLSSKALDGFSKRNVSRQELQEHLKPILIGLEPICGILGTSSKQIVSVNKAYQLGMIRRSEALGLLEAQIATGSLIDPKNMKKMSVKSAVKHGLIDSQFEDVLERSQKAVYGNADHGSLQLMSIHKAMKLGSIAEIEGIKLLDVQLSTGGIIDPETGCRLPENIAVRSNLIDEQLLSILSRPPTDKKAFYDHNTGKNITYRELLKKSVMVQKKEMQMRLLPIEDGIRITTSVTSTNEKQQRRSRKNSSKTSSNRR